MKRERIVPLDQGSEIVHPIALSSRSLDARHRDCPSCKGCFPNSFAKIADLRACAGDENAVEKVREQCNKYMESTQENETNE